MARAAGVQTIVRAKSVMSIAAAIRRRPLGRKRLCIFIFLIEIKRLE
jgi:hypothetical protein